MPDPKTPLDRTLLKAVRHCRPLTADWKAPIEEDRASRKKSFSKR